jgi:hypothetical protein
MAWSKVLLIKALLSYSAARREARQQDIDSQLSAFALRAKRRRKQTVLLFAERLLNESAQATLKKKRLRRVILRAKEGWQGSTMFGYTNPDVNDDQTYRDNFRMDKATFAMVAKDLQESGCTFAPRMGCAPRQTPCIRFKLGTCLYVLAIGCCTKAAADTASIGKKTVELWLKQFQEAVLKTLRPKYMPAKPLSVDVLECVRSEFAARRGVPNVAMACDGSHVPFGTTHAEYRNYKGWYSILCVAFVNSYHLFVDADVGFPGQAGDNTVLRHSWLMGQIKADPTAWLGQNGVILGDGGASDGDGVFMNPYPNPHTDSEFYFNFCHSSTRFFVEEVFGRWKNRFRFLLHTHDMKHKLFSQLVYSTMILHNICTMHKGNEITFNIGSDEEWQQYFKKYARDSCPSCTRANLAHCIHTRHNRERHKGGAVSGAPSKQRDELKEALWQSLADGEYNVDGETQVEMDRRAQEGVRHN